MFLSNHTTFSQTYFGATVPLREDLHYCIGPIRQEICILAQPCVPSCCINIRTVYVYEALICDRKLYLEHYVKTMLQMGNRAREPIGDALEASVDLTYRKGAASDSH
jgi:hypothetical protein